MPSLTLLIIRHAEKPKEQWPGPGSTFDATPDKESLVIRGWQRAGAWTTLFGTPFGGANYPTPARIYAADPDVIDPTDSTVSRRPSETVSALKDKGIKTVEKFAKGQEDALVEKLVTIDGVVLVCWEHKAIAKKILPRLPIQGPRPTNWDDSRYDVVLRLDRADGAANFVLRQLFPMLLSGDSDEPLH
jgi:hypothetical protein